MSEEAEAPRELHTARKEIIELMARRLVKNANEKAQKPLQRVKENLPSDPEQVRALPFYNTILEAIQNQRDQYLVGTQYAEQRKQQRQEFAENGDDTWQSLVHNNRIPYDATALGSIQIVNLGAWFIPSETVRSALLPIVLSLPNGALRGTIVNTTVNALPLAQLLVDHAVKDSLLTFMQNPYWRAVIKKRTKGYMGHRDSNTPGGVASGEE